VVAKCLQSKDTTPISPLEAGLSLGWASGPLGAIFELLKHMGIQSNKAAAAMSVVRQKCQQVGYSFLQLIVAWMAVALYVIVGGISLRADVSTCT
jgi:hypothetical protein